MVARQAVSSQHHTTWLFLIPRYNQRGEPLVERDGGYVKFLVRDAGPGPEVREFRLDLPLSESSPGPLMAYLLIPLAVAGLLMYAVSPCAVGNFALASVIMTASGSRRQRWLNMASFGGGYVTALLLGGTALLVLGTRLNTDPFWTRPLEIVGGLIMALLGLWLLASPGWGPSPPCWAACRTAWAAAWPRAGEWGRAPSSAWASASPWAAPAAWASWASPC